MFIQAFDNSVGNAPVSDSAKLNRLLQYCKGEALKVIRCCAVKPAPIGYAKARSLLKERFGNDYKISEVWIKKVTEGPFIKSGDRYALQEISDDLESCKETLEAMDTMEEIDTRRSMVKIVERLPRYLQDRWRREAVKALDRLVRYPSGLHLVEFLNTATRETNDPVFEVLVDRTKDSGKSQSTPRNFRRKGANFNVQAMVSSNNSTASLSTKDPQTKSTCELCCREHHLSECTKFRSMSPEKRLETVKEKRLCFNCFATKHMARSCWKASACDVHGCLSKHSKLLHYPLQSPGGRPRLRQDHGVEQQGRAEDKDQPVKGHICACGPSQPETSKIALPIVSVKVRAKGQRKYVHTYALLDSGSTKTFCSRTGWISSAWKAPRPPYLSRQSRTMRGLIQWW